MLSPAASNSKRVFSPSKQLSSSPRGTKRKFSSADILGVLFLRYSKWLLVGVVGIGVVRMFAMDPLPMDSSGSNVLDPVAPTTPTTRGRITLSPTTNSSLFNHSSSSPNQGANDGTNKSNTKSSTPTKTKTKEPKIQEQEKLIDTNSSGEDNASNAVVENSNYHHLPPEEDQSIRSDGTNPGETISNETSSSGKSDDVLSSFKASNAPVILDGWNRTVQVHLIVDLTSSGLVINPAAKQLLDAVERSEYTQLTALTVVRPAITTIDMFPRKPDLPLLFLIDWGSMDRDCHRLQLVLENLRLERELLTKNATSNLPAETEEPYFLLVDSTGSTRQTGCEYLFQSSSVPKYAHTNDMRRIRLAKRSIVRNRYYDPVTKRIHMGEIIPNRWDGTPLDYDRPILQSPFALRESFAMGIHNITDGKAVITNRDGMRGTDVGFFWKAGDYSHYGFYRRDIAKVVKKFHHSSLKTPDGKRRMMENRVAIAYSDAKEMEAGYVQFKYIDELLQCKIVVITQRDEWEDHYRLMESLASGALVMTDSMVSLPEGLVDKVNIVVYDSPQMLKDLIKYYLKPKNRKERKDIAEKGYRLVMGRHRSWHRLEELLFGRPLSHVDRRDAPEKEVPPSYSYVQGDF